ncbi:MAG TPA: serine hydrolase, partial [Candidatus Paceibacterota bacterium]|nr:serine hydrolase [Candidatus Paceibacterota bacterium]
MDIRTEKIIFIAVAVFVIILGSNFGSARQSAPGVFVEQLAAAGSAAGSQPVDTPPVFILSAPTPGTEKDPKQVEQEALDALITKGIDPNKPEEKPLVQPEVSAVHPESMQVGSLSASQSFRPMVFHPTDPVSEPTVNAVAALVADLTTGETYYTLNADKRWPIASITKLLTAATALTLPAPTGTITLTEADFVPADETVMKRLTVGDAYSFSDLFAAMLTVSSNEAAEAIANAFGRDNFINDINGLVAQWGLQDTHVSDPTGLSAANQSTAQELKQLALKIYTSYPQIFDATRKPKVSIRNTVTGKRQTLQNIDFFAGQAGFVGGKTGYTDE